MKRHATLFVAAWAVFFFGFWTLHSTDHATAAATQGKAYFAGGCFWCMEEAFEKVEGVLSVTSGYMGGTVANPSYEEVSAGRTGHAESVEVLYDPVSYTHLTLPTID
jgi:peptide-methionine (S)-S-oxide reductase